MTWSLLLPAGAVVTALTVLAVSFARLDRELTDLRESLRRTRATAVATDELERLSSTVASRAAAIDADTRTRRHRRRSRRAAGHR